MNQVQSQVMKADTNPPYLRLPESQVFDERASRFLALADRHSSLADYLRFLAAICRAQQSALLLMAEPPLPDAEQQQRCREHSIPMLGTQGWRRHVSWHEALEQILVRMEEVPAMPDPARQALTRLRQASSEDWEAMADMLLAGDFTNKALDLAAAPFVAAALQVYWMRMAAALGRDAFGRMDKPALCPVCGSPPIASEVRIGGDQGLRYAVCSLCLSEWNVVRIKCVQCESTKGITYYAIAGEGEAVKAEWCPTCDTYLKIMYMNKDPDVDPVADDVASLALDVLMTEEGKARYGINYFLLTGDTEQQEHDSDSKTS